MDEGDADEEGKNNDDEDGFSDLPDDDEGDPFNDPLDDQQRKPEDDGMEDLVDDEPSKEEDGPAEKVDEEENGEPQPEPEESTDEQVARNDGEEAIDEDKEDGEEQGGQDDGQQPQPQPQPQGEDEQPVNMNDSGVYDHGADVGEDASAEQEQSSRGQQGRRVEAQQSSAAEDGMVDENDDQTAQPTDQDPSAGGGQSRAQRPQPQAEAPESAPQAEQANPVRSLGDALEEFRKRFEEIQEQSEDANEQGEAMPEAGDVEHVAEDEDTEMQALGAARNEDEVQKLGDLAIEDQQEELGHKPRVDDEQTIEAEQAREPHQLPEQAERENVEAGQQKALMPADIKASETQRLHDNEAGEGAIADDEEDEDVKVKKEAEEEEMTPVPEDERREADAALQTELQEFRSIEADAERHARAGDLWRSYSALTADLAFSLCEQLRLILAPSLATRLNGDFRTGKRLNMRKIVPFIASDFAKDKIWLRRTKPSAREYQVLLAVDDSRSMAESRSAHLAYQTVSLVSGALARLEVGDVSICRFGEDVETLHPFGAGEADGAHLIDRLRFDQRGTDVLSLVQNSLDMLSDARETRSSTTGKELWQLEIIISDGVCQNHDRLRPLLRRAAEQRVMLVFVIIDSLASERPSSITTMSSVKYVTDANGRLQLEMERYLDSFPFEYYVVVRDVDALPDVLAATLRQWVEKIRETE